MRGLHGSLSQLIMLACLLAFGLALKASYDLEEASAYRLPRMVALFGLVAASIELTVASLGSRATPRPRSEPGGLPILSSIGFTVVYFSLVPLLGFVLATGLAIAGFGHLTRYPRPRLVILLAVVVPVILYLTFGELLKAPLPAGFLGAPRF